MQSTAAVWPEIKAEIMAVRDASSYRKGAELDETFIQRYKNEYPSLVACLWEDLEACLGHLKTAGAAPQECQDDESD